MNIQGTIHAIGETTRINDKLTKREFILKDDSQYPQLIKFELINDKCSLLDNVWEGDSINVHFNIRGRESKGNYYNSLVCWKIE